jgi:hypothetical protein
VIFCIDKNNPVAENISYKSTLTSKTSIRILDNVSIGVSDMDTNAVLIQELFGFNLVSVFVVDSFTKGL